MPATPTRKAETMTVDLFASYADVKPAPANREAWLNAAVKALRPLFAGASVTLPELHVSCGFPGGGSARKRIGECWSSKASDGRPQVFISPVLDDPAKVLATLVHELIHAHDDCEHGHKAPFARVARKVGLVGKMTATTASPELAAKLATIAAELGAYPHSAIALGMGTTKKQTTRMIKVECEQCGYVARTSSKWLEDVGAPLCACSGEQMSVAL